MERKLYGSLSHYIKVIMMTYAVIVTHWNKNLSDVLIVHVLLLHIKADFTAVNKFDLARQTNTISIIIHLVI